MNLKLDELRKLLLQPEPPTMNVQERRSGSLGAFPSSRNREAEDDDDLPNTTGENSSMPNSLASEVLQYVSAAGPQESDGKPHYQLAHAVAKVFEPTRTFHESLARLSKSFEQVDILGQSAARALAPMKAFQDQVAQISQNFGPMKAFQDQLAQLAQNFEPMKGLHEQLSQIGHAFHDHLLELSRTLEPAKKLQHKVAELAHSLESVSALQEDFLRLADSFKVPPAPVTGAGEALSSDANGYPSGASRAA